MLKYPAFIKVQTADNSWTLLKKGKDRYWNSEDIKVDLSNENNSLVVSISAINTEVKQIQLTWRHKFESTTEFLGDAFERGYGDLGFQRIHPDRKMYWYFIAKNNSDMEGWGVKTSSNALAYWKITDGTVDLWLDIRSGTEPLNLKGRQLLCANVVHQEEKNESSLVFATDFCKSLASKPFKQLPPIYGANDWYAAYGASSEKLILKMTEILSELTMGNKIKPFMVIDDGWEINKSSIYNGGPWQQSNRRFPNMSTLVAKMKEMNVRPGIWFRPLLVQNTAQFSKSMLLRKFEDGTAVLDPSSPEVLSHVAEDLRNFRSWGIELVKHDFSTFDIFNQWGFQMEDDYFSDKTVFFDDTKTTAEIINQFYQTIKLNASDMLINGCNTISHLSAGIFDVQRTGDDTSGKEFARTRKMGVNSLAFRMPQNNVYYRCDADCVGITKSISWKENEKWLDVLAESGTSLFVSFVPEELTDEMKNTIDKAFKTTIETTKSAVPLDWEYQQFPKQWVTDDGITYYEWYKIPRES